jgi:RHS repeat-associated protein
MWLDPTGFCAVRARAYDPSTGYFTSQDPAVPSAQEPETVAHRRFARHNPFVYRDPTGRAETTVMGLTFAQLIVLTLATIATPAIACGATWGIWQLIDSFGGDVPNGPCRPEDEDAAFYQLLEESDAALGAAMYSYGLRHMPVFDIVGLDFNMIMFDRIFSQWPSVPPHDHDEIFKVEQTEVDDEFLLFARGTSRPRGVDISQVRIFRGVGPYR